MRERALKMVLVVVGTLFVAGVDPLTDSLWHTNGQATGSEGDTMMLSIYVALGVFLLLGVRNPSANRSLIAFAAWANFAHAAVMAVMAIRIPSERGNLLMAVALFGVIGAALLVVTPAKAAGERASPLGA